MLRIRLIVGTIAALSLAAACRTPSASTTKSADLAESSGAPGPIVAMVADDVAETIYNAYKVDEQTTDGGASKSYSGNLWAHCGKTGGSNLPPGAQGIVASGSVYNCAVTVPMHFPNGAQGLPAPPMVQFSGFAAQKFFEAMQVPATQSSGAQKSWGGTGAFTCQYTTNDGGDKTYQCTLAGNADSGSGSGDNGGGYTKTIVALNGTVAQNLYKKLTSVNETATANGKSKMREGDLAVDCSRTLGGGALPPGTQGIAAPAATTCALVAPASIPQGAQGFPGPATPLAKLTGADATAFYNAFDVATKNVGNKTTKSFNDSAQLECHYANLQGVKTWACTVMGKDGGAAGGVEGYDISGNKTSCVPSSQNICTQQITSGDLFKEQCAGNGGTPIYCKCHTYLCSKGPGDDTGGGGDSNSIVSLTDDDAAKFFAALTITEKKTQTGGTKSRTGNVSIDCSQKTNALPPGAQGIAAPTPKTTCTVFTGSSLPPGAQGIAGPTQLAKLTGVTANHFYDAFNADEAQSGSNMEKTFSGKATINCHYALMDGLKSGWKCGVTAAGTNCPPPPDCAAPPQGCSYTMAHDSNGCLSGCGSLNCNGGGGFPGGAQGLPAPD